jgi:hypothetical protein
MRKYPTRADLQRYLAIVYLDDYGVPTGMSASYYIDIPGDRHDVEGLFKCNPGFQCLGDFEDRQCADAVVCTKLELIIDSIAPERRAGWPTNEDYEYCVACPVCKFMYHPGLPKEVERHNQFHTEHIMAS